MKGQRHFRGFAFALIGAGCLSAGCSDTHATARPDFSSCDRVAILCSALTRDKEEVFIPLYMDAFPNQHLVDGRDVQAIVGDEAMTQGQTPDEQTRSKLLRSLGVKAIVYPSDTGRQFAIKVIDTKTGEILAAVVISGHEVWSGDNLGYKDLVEKAIGALKDKAGST